MTGGQVHAHGGAERHARDVSVLDPDGAEEGGDLVGLAVGRVWPGRLVALAGAGKVNGDAIEVLGVRRELERPACVVGRGVGDQQKRLALPLHVVVDQLSVYVDAWHARSYPAGGSAALLSQRGMLQSGPRILVRSPQDTRGAKSIIGIVCVMVVQPRSVQREGTPCERIRHDPDWPTSPAAGTGPDGF